MEIEEADEIVRVSRRPAISVAQGRYAERRMFPLLLGIPNGSGGAIHATVREGSVPKPGSTEQSGTRKTPCSSREFIVLRVQCRIHYNHLPLGLSL